MTVSSSHVAIRLCAGACVRLLTADDGGNSTRAGLPLMGRYKVSVTSGGFAPRELSDVELRADGAATLNVTLLSQGLRLTSKTTRRLK